MPTAAPTPGPSPAPTQPPATPAPTPTPTPPTDAFAAARARCLQKTNAFRATQNVTPLTARVDRESCGDGQAQADATSNAPHGSFGKCKELAQNECPGWKGSPESIVDTCLKAMFDEGPGQGPQHGHHNNIMSTTYSGMSCSFFVAGDGSVWLVQNFYK